MRGNTAATGWKSLCVETGTEDCRLELEAQAESGRLSALLGRDALDVALLWERIQTQWRWAGMGQRVGLDYVAVEATARMLGIRVDEWKLELLQTLEVKRLKQWDEEEKRKKAITQSQPQPQPSALKKIRGVK